MSFLILAHFKNPCDKFLAVLLRLVKNLLAFVKPNLCLLTEHSENKIIGYFENEVGPGIHTGKISHRKDRIDT